MKMTYRQNMFSRAVTVWMVAVRAGHQATHETVMFLANPPLQAGALGLFIGLIHPLKSLFVGTGSAPLRCVLDAFATLGSAQVPLSMLTLSGSGTLKYMAQMRHAVKQQRGSEAVERDFSFTTRAAIATIGGRVLMMPVIGYGCWAAFMALGIMPTDNVMMSFVVLLESAVPSAQNVVMLLLVHGEVAQGSAMALLILWQYAVAIPIFTCCVFWFQVIVMPLGSS